MEYNVVEDQIPLVSYARTRESVWNVYIGGVIQVRETNAGLVQIRVGDSTVWETVSTKEAAR